MSGRPFEIGDAHGRIALYLNKQSALDLAQMLGPSDMGYDELMLAVSREYPDDPAPGQETRLWGLDLRTNRE